MIGFVINLDRRKDKWEYAEDVLKCNFGHDFYRFSAVEGGWKGCRDSHLAILDFARHLDEEFVVFEDDVQWVHDEYVDIELPDEWDCVYLGASPQEYQQRYNDHLYRISNSYCTHAIIWNPKSKAIEYMLKHRSEIGKIDVYMSEVIFPKFNCFLTKPLIVSQKQFQSDTCGRSDVSTIITNYNKYCL